MKSTVESYRSHALSLRLAASVGPLVAAWPVRATGALAQTARQKSAKTFSSESSSTTTSVDRDTMKNLAQANIAGIQAGTLGKRKSQSADIQRFAQLLDDHSEAPNKSRALADRKSITRPSDADMAHKPSAVAMHALSGNMSDKHYTEHAGVGDHRHTLKSLQRIGENAGDSDLRQLAAQMIPVVQLYHRMAQHLEGQLTAGDRE